MYVEYKTTLFNLFLPNKKPLLAKNMVLQIQKLANKIYSYKRDYIIKLLEKNKIGIQYIWKVSNSYTFFSVLPYLNLN
jgi:hypothetical protein